MLFSNNKMLSKASIFSSLNLMENKFISFPVCNNFIASF